MVDTLRFFAKRAQGMGMPAEQAAQDIAKGLSKKTPPRFLYTGHSVWEVMFYGAAQNLFLNDYASYRSLINAGFGLLWKDNVEKKKLMDQSQSATKGPVHAANGTQKPGLVKADDEVPLILRKEE